MISTASGSSHLAAFLPPALVPLRFGAISFRTAITLISMKRCAIGRHGWVDWGTHHQAYQQGSKIMKTTLNAVQRQRYERVRYCDTYSWPQPPWLYTQTNYKRQDHDRKDGACWAHPRLQTLQQHGMIDGIEWRQKIKECQHCQVSGVNSLWNVRYSTFKTAASVEWYAVWWAGNSPDDVEYTQLADRQLTKRSSNFNI